jgi:hypothetical protein
MSVVRLLEITRLACGCVVGKYRELDNGRDVHYVEEKGLNCRSHSHRRNHKVAVERLASVSPITLVGKAS